jgi:hypothetical protein
MPSAGDEVSGARVLGHIERVLVAHIDDGRAEFDLLGFSACGSEEREGRRQLTGKVVDTEIGAIRTQFLSRHGKVDRLQKRVTG